MGDAGQHHAVDVQTVTVDPERRFGEISAQAAAIPAIFDIGAEDPLPAALTALYAAAYTFGADGYRGLLTEVRDLLR